FAVYEIGAIVLYLKSFKPTQVLYCARNYSWSETCCYGAASSGGLRLLRSYSHAHREAEDLPRLQQCLVEAVDHRSTMIVGNRQTNAAIWSLVASGRMSGTRKLVSK